MGNLIIIENIPLVEEILSEWKQVIGTHYEGYKNHVYRMIHFCFYLHDCSVEEREKIIIAGCFHDLGIWTKDTLDYLPPSIILAKEYLKKNDEEAWNHEIELMIDMHHKIRSFTAPKYPLVEVFRRGDLVDFSLGFVKCGLPKEYIQKVKSQFPNAGFHKFLVTLTTRWFVKHPLNPAPIMRW